MIKSVIIKFDKILHDTGKAVLVRINGVDHWLGYFMFKKLIINKKLGGNLSLLTNYADEKGIYYDKSMADIIIVHHMPEKTDKTKIKHDNSLFK